MSIPEQIQCSTQEHACGHNQLQQQKYEQIYE